MQPREEGHERPAADVASRSFSLFKAAIEAIGDAVVVTSRELDPPGPLIEYVNPAFSRMTGYAADEVIGRSPRMFQGPLTDRAELVRLRTCLDTGAPFQGEVVNYCKDGQPRVIEWLVTGVEDEAGTVVRWLSVQRDVTRRKQLEHRQELLVGELHHRTRNLLTVVGALAARTLTRSPERDAFDGRLAALSRVQSFLSDREAWSVDLAHLVDAELEAVGEQSSARTTITGPSVTLPGDTVQALALVLHELVTNAVKHGVFAQPGGRLAIDWAIGAGGRLTLRWAEQGITVVDPAPRAAFGRELIERSLGYQLRAETSYEFGPDRVVCTIILPTEALA